MFWREEDRRAERNYLSHMLNKRNRLTSKEVAKVFEIGKSFGNGFLRLKMVPNTVEIPRFAIIASQKIYKKANKRVAIRRRIYEIVRKMLPDIKIKIDAIVFVNENKTIDHKELKDSVSKLFIKSGLL
jgi:ribonuclease P protein component